VPAGSETTTTAIRATMLYLITAPVAYQKLKAEISAAIRAGRLSSPATGNEGRQLPFLQAVLNEGIRMLPPAVTGFAKRVPPGGDTLCGRFVPAGTDIFSNAAMTLRDPDVFGDDPDVFRPERFLECTPEKKAVMLKTVELVFGHGRWMCPGKLLAWMELNKVFIEVRFLFFFFFFISEFPIPCPAAVCALHSC
jgi:cytochrome P450